MSVTHIINRKSCGWANDSGNIHTHVGHGKARARGEVYKALAITHPTAADGEMLSAIAAS